MTISEFRMILNNLAQQAQMHYEIEKKKGNVGDINLTNLEYYKNSIADLSRSINDMLDTRLPITDAVNKDVTVWFSNAFRALYKINTVYPDFTDKHYEDLQNLQTIISSVDTSTGKTLEDAIKDTLENVVTLKSDPDFMGEVSSQRFMVKVKRPDGTEVEGFFTKERGMYEFDHRNVVDGILNKALKDNISPENNQPIDDNLDKFIKQVLNSPYKSSTLIICARNKRDLDNDKRTMAAARKAARRNRREYVEPDFLDGYDVANMKALKFIGHRDQLSLDEIKRNENIMKLLKQIRATMTEEDIANIKREVGQYHKGALEGIGAEHGSAKAGRNYALYKVAQLLGASDVIAKATPMTAEYNGQHYRGIFMEKCKGECFAYNKREEMLATDFRKMTSNSFSGEILEKIAKIQIIDYICQNVDRHCGNFIFDLDEEGKVTNILGIDNDLSFGTKVSKPAVRLQKGVTLLDIRVIPEEMANIIMKMSPNTLAGVLKDTGLTEAERVAAANRLKKLQDYISHCGYDSQTYDKIDYKLRRLKIISHKDWKDYRIENLGEGRILGKTNTSAFEQVDFIRRQVKEWNEAERGDPNLQRQIQLQTRRRMLEEKKFEEAEEINLVSVAGLNRHQNTLKDYLNKFINTENKFQTTHTEYTNMKAELDSLAKENPDEKMDMNERLIFEEKLLSLEKTVNTYIAYKAPKKETRNGVKRLKEAKALSQYLNSYRKSFHKAYNEKLEAELDRNYQEYVNERKINRIANAIARGFMKKVDEAKNKNAVQDVEMAIRETDAFKEMISTDKRNVGNYTNLDHYNKLTEKNPENAYNEYLSVMKALSGNKGKEKAKEEEKAVIKGEITL